MAKDMAKDKGKSRYTVTRTATMAAPPSAVYEQVASFHSWQRWSPWEGIDPEMQRTYEGPSSGEGAAYSWSGNRKAGKGRMVITDATPPSRVAIDLTFDKPFKAHNETVLSISPEGQGSRVDWTMHGENTMLTRVMSVVVPMDKLVGKDFERGLANLKDTVEGRR